MAQCEQLRTLLENGTIRFVPLQAPNGDSTTPEVRNAVQSQGLANSIDFDFLDVISDVSVSDVSDLSD